MAYIEELAKKVRDSLVDVQFEEKKMFGGIGFMVNGKLCITVNQRPDHVMMVRINPAIENDALTRHGASPAIMRGRKMKGWIFLTAEALKSEEDYNFWVSSALEYNKLIV